MAARYEVHLGCFVDDADDEKYVGEIGKYCKTTCIRKLNRFSSTIKSAKGLVNGNALSLPYYFDRTLATWIDDVLATSNVSAIVAFSSPMGQYVLGPQYKNIRRIMDFVDIDSDKWRQYAKRSHGPMKWIYSREAALLEDFERNVTEAFDSVVFVSENETSTFSSQWPDTKMKHFTVCNGVATDYFDPALEFISPFNSDVIPIVFTGLMDYWPNVDAVGWFAREVLSEVRNKIPKLQFWIVGASPTNEILKLDSDPGIVVTGKVPDVRPYLKHAAAVIAPLKIARGVQNKVLEGLAMGRPVICTPQAAAGLSDKAEAPIRVASSQSEFVDSVVDIVRTGVDSELSNRSMSYVLENYNWERNLSLFSDLLTASPTRSRGLKREPLCYG